MFSKQNLKKQLALLICICIIVASVSGIYFAASHSIHHCSGYNCFICHQIKNFNSVNKQLGLFLCSVFIIKIMLSYFSIFKLYLAESSLSNITLVSLKVRLDD